MPSNLALSNTLAISLGMGVILAGDPTKLLSAELEGHQHMAQLLAEIAASASRENDYFNETGVEELRTEIGQASSDLPDGERISQLLNLGQQELYLGMEREAISRLERAKGLIQQNGGTTESLNAARFQLGVAYLRLGETENCCARNNQDSCILPIKGEGVHSLTEGSSKAANEFLEILESGSSDSDLGKSAIWLLNIASMTLGTYPTGVPRAFLIPPARFQSSIDFPRFPNIAPQLGIDTFSQLGGAICDDFNGDGFLDWITSSWRPGDPLRIWLNDGNGGFYDHTPDAGLEGITGGCNLVQADYDNDGDLDVYVMRGGWFADFGKHPNSLLRNDGRAVFRDATFEAGLGESRYPSQTAAFADYDLDGDLDLYVGNESSDSVDAPCELYQNQGDGMFVDVASFAGVENGKMAKGVAWGDFDGDRYPDLYVSNFGAPNRLYRNNGDGTFWDEAIEEGVHEPQDSFACWFWDYNNDGYLDLFVTDYSGKVADIAQFYIEDDANGKRDRLYEGLPGGGFAEVSLDRGLRRPTFAMGANFGDLDNDGYLDFFLGTGWPDYYQLMPNVMFLSRAGETFADVTTSGGFGNLQKGHGVAFADFDNDGDQDVFIQLGGALQGDKYFDALHRNPGFGNDWIALRLRGVASNACAIGARIKVVVKVEGGGIRSIYRHVSSGGSFGANPLQQNVGLGKAVGIESIEVLWPASDRVQVFRDPPINRFLELVESEFNWRLLH